MQLDRVASEIVLRSVRDAIPSRWAAKVAELRALAATPRRVTLAEYLGETGLDLGDIYTANRGWSDLQSDAGILLEESGPFETALRRGLGRMLHVDDQERLSAYAELLQHRAPPSVAKMSPYEQRLARMLLANIAATALERSASLQEAIDLVWRHPQVIAESLELFEVLNGRVDHLHRGVLPGVPLQIHAQYTRVEILAAVGEGTSAITPQWREGVYDAKGAGADLLAFTLDKTSGDFSPTTRYRDYAISPNIIHWESQSGTRADSPTGRRYQNHRAMDRSILLFVRVRADERAFWFLGAADYVAHEGERPMSITWRLRTPLSGDLFASFAAAV